MDRQLVVDKLVIHCWARNVNEGDTFNCGYWDCANQILPGDTYYDEIYPQGQTESYCLECSAYFMGQALNTLVSNWE
jgi:hypothetical protein